VSRAIAPLSTLLVPMLVTACGDDDAPPDDGGPPVDDAGGDDAGPRDWPACEVPASTVHDGVRRDVFLVPGTTPPENPETGDATPEELDATQVLRYRQDVDPPAPARAILIAMPGFLGGGPSFDPLARALVARGEESGETLEVWAIDRRSNLLEDLRGMDAAEAEADPAIAQGYYFGRETVGGEAFEGFVPQGRVRYMSEWGLATHVADLRRVVALVPESARRDHVFLMGHSLGAAFTEAYASWRFEDGSRGVEELAGLVLIDGELPSEAISETQYHEGAGTGLMMQPGLDAIRGGTSYTALPILGLDVYTRAEIMSLRVLLSPDEIRDDPGRDRLLALLLQLPSSDVPAMTNRASLGFGFDRRTNPLLFAQVSLGAPTGGPVEEYTSDLTGEMLVHPTDPDATYEWDDGPGADPTAHTPMDHLARSFVHGRSNFAEWYFPARLPIDIAAVAGTDVPEGDWREDMGLTAFDRELVDAPVLAVAADLVGPGGFAELEGRLGPEVGEGRPHAGATRSEETGLRIVDATHLSHIDPLSAADGGDDPVPEEVERFVLEHVGAGTVDVGEP